MDVIFYAVVGDELLCADENKQGLDPMKTYADPTSSHHQSPPGDGGDGGADFMILAVVFQEDTQPGVFN